MTMIYLTASKVSKNKNMTNDSLLHLHLTHFCLHVRVAAVYVTVMWNECVMAVLLACRTDREMAIMYVYKHGLLQTHIFETSTIF